MKSAIFWAVTLCSVLQVHRLTKNILPPSSGSKNKLSRKPARYMQEAERTRSSQQELKIQRRIWNVRAMRYWDVVNGAIRVTNTHRQQSVIVIMAQLNSFRARQLNSNESDSNSGITRLEFLSECLSLLRPFLVFLTKFQCTIIWTKNTSEKFYLQGYNAV
jgi:hypothetical protein